MKHYFFTDRPDTHSRKGDRIIRCYAIRCGEMKQITYTSYRPGSTRGALAEAFQALMSCGEIPKKYETSSVSSWCGPGYFHGPVTKNYSIQEIY